MKKRELPDPLIESLTRLTKNSDIVMAGRLLNMYFIRQWKVDEQLAKYYTLKWFEKNYPSELKRYRQLNKPFK
ncbi:hypothetical protein [Alkalihalophilus marmarensis]|uniref:hypothetical protein n=1 Tax=Alkalihalophilus marmarensis TaxID=521377 RepID=UPI002E1E71CF|nr:hypothetical protein [Alkalihalophilus marmarensis]